MKLKDIAPWKKSNDKPRQCIKKQTLLCQYSQSYGFSCSHVWMWEQDNKKDWVPNNLCLWTVVLEKTLESPMDCKEIKLVSPKRHQPLIFILEKEMATHSSILAWRIPWTEEPGRLQSMGSQRVGHDWSDLALNIHWKTVTETETPILWASDVKSQYIGRDPDAGKDWRQEEKGMTEDEMVGWHHRLNGDEFG